MRAQNERPVDPRWWQPIMLRNCFWSRQLRSVMGMACWLSWMGMGGGLPLSRRKMYQLTHNGQPVGTPHPHRITCYIEALERGLVKRGAGRYWFWGLKIERIEQEQSE